MVKHNSNNVSTYDKTQSTIIAGIAIVLMFFHHLFGFPEFLRTDVNWNGIQLFNGCTLEFAFARFAKLCVSLFAFNTGYAMYCQRRKYLSFFPLTQRIAKFLLAYWICYGLFLIYAFFVKDPLPDATNIILNLFGLNCSLRNSFVSICFAWYVSFYIICMLLAPLIIRFFQNGSLIKDLLGIVILRIFLSAIQSIDLNFLYGLQRDLWPLFIVCAAFLVAKYEIFRKIARLTSHLNLWFIILSCVLLIVIGAYLRINNYAGSVTDFLESLILISIFLELFNRYNAPKLFTLLTVLGANSMLLWFIHSLYFTASKPLQKVIYYSESPLIILFTAFILIWPICLGLNPLIKKICNYFEKYLSRLIPIQ